MPMADHERRQAIYDYDPDWNKTTEQLEQEAREAEEAYQRGEEVPLNRNYRRNYATV